MMRSLHNRCARTVGGARLLSALILFSVVLASCISSSSETVTYSDTALTGFTLGTLKSKRTYHVTTKSGNDSTYTVTTTYSGSSFPMHINQNTNEVYNTDSLRYGTDLSKVVCTISTLNNGQVYFQTLDNPNGYEYYSSTDSVDLSIPRVLSVMSSDGTETREYTVNVRVRQTPQDSLKWSAEPINDAASCLMLATFDSMSGLTTKDAMYVLGQTDDGGAALLRSEDDGKSWNEVEVQLPKYTSNMALADDTVMVMLKDRKQIMKVAPSGGITYTDVDAIEDYSPSAQSFITLAGGVEGSLYAVHAEGRRIYVSRDGGATWYTEKTDATDFINNDYRIPTIEVNGILTKTKENSLPRLTIVGNCAQEIELDDTYFKYASTWSKVIDREYISKELQDCWTYCEQTGLNVPVRLPNRQNLSVTSWNGAMVAFGGEARYDDKLKDYDRLYVSYDNGTTWTSKDMNLPKGFDAGDAAIVTTDTDGRIVVIGNGHVWRGTK